MKQRNKKRLIKIVSMVLVFTMIVTLSPVFVKQTSAAPPESTLILPRFGEDKLIVVLVEFRDVKLATVEYGAKSPEQYWSDLIFGGLGTGRSVNSFYNENSNGKFRFVPERLPNSREPVAGVYRVSLPDPYVYYGNIAMYAMDALQEQYNFKFAEAYPDTFLKSRNPIEGAAFCPPGGLHLMFVAAGCGAGGGKGRTDDSSGEMLGVPNTMYNHIVIEEKISDDTMNPVGVPAHELAHDVGLPDLYSYGESYGDEPDPEYYTSLDIGIYGSDATGDAPTHFDPWSKQKMGWYTSTTTIPERLYPAGDSENYNILKIFSPDPYQYFLVENRQQQGFDSGLGNGISKGIVFWRIDEWVNGNKDDYALNAHARHGVTVLPKNGVKNASQGAYSLNEEVFLTYHTGATTPETPVGWGGQIWMRDATKEAMPRAYRVINGVGGGLTVKEMGEFSTATAVTDSDAMLNFTTAATGKDKGFQYKIYASTSQLDVADLETMKSQTPVTVITGTNADAYSYKLNFNAIPGYQSGDEVYYNIIVDASTAAAGIFPSGTTGGIAAYRAANISGKPNLLKNYALGKPAKAYNASGILIGTSDVLTNGIANDIWTPNNGNYPTTFVVELEENKRLEFLEIEWEKTGLPFQFRVYADIQGQGETLLLDKSAQTGVLGKKEVIQLKRKQVSSVKIEIIGKNGAGNFADAWASISEVRALGSASSAELEITSIEMEDTPKVGEPVTFTVQTVGGQTPYKYAFYVIGGGKVQHKVVYSNVNTFSYIPNAKGSYSVRAYAIDKTRKRFFLSRDFTVI